MRRMYSTVALAALFTLAGAAMTRSPLAAQSGGDALKVACVDVVHVFNEYQRQKDLSEEMKEVQGQLERESEQRKARIDTANAALSAMDPEDPMYQNKTRELLEMNIAYKNWIDVNQAAMAREIGVWTGTVYKEILKEIENTAKERGYDLVLYIDEFDLISVDPNEVREQIRNRKVLYANERANISQLILDRLNATYRAQPRKKMINLP